MSETPYGDAVPGERGDTRTPKLGDWLRGVWASPSNPQRDGMYVETIRRSGRLNPGTLYRLTDGKGHFWLYHDSQTVFLPPETAEGGK